MAKKTTIKGPQRLPKSLLKEAKTVIKQKWSYPDMAHYDPQEKLVTTLFRKMYPTNTNQAEVLVKAFFLNQFYSTNIRAISKIGKGIVPLQIDNRLKKGDISVVDDIAKILPARRNYSFASKYCACHNPKAYPINDKLVRSYLAKVIAKGNLSGFSGKKTAVEKQLYDDYSFYKDVYDAFMKQYRLTSLTYRQVDWYIWVACKCKLNNLDLFKLI